MNRFLRPLVFCCALLAVVLAAYSQQSPAPPPVPPAATPAKQPVFILLNTRFYDHTNPQYSLERINMLLPVLRTLRQRYPNSGISSVFQFSGSISEVLSGLSERQPEVQDVKKAVAAGLIEVGYTGEDEPTYANRPQADFLFADTPEQRWLARTAAAERFLTDYKDPVTGDPVPGLSGGFKRMQEVFGEAAFASGLTLNVGDGSPFLYQLRRQNAAAVISGFPEYDRVLGVITYRTVLAAFTKLVSPAANTSPEVFWEDNVLHSSDSSGADSRVFSTEEGPVALKAAFDKMDRSVVRIIHMEVGSYLRYMKKSADGTVTYPPLEWTYQHPQTPEMPATLKSFLEKGFVDDAYRKEGETLRWLLERFLPENPGSRFISIADLKKMAPSPLDTDVSRARLRLAATDLLSQYATSKPNVPGFARGEDEYFSLSDMFALLSGALAEFRKTGTLPDKVRLTNVYGPLQITTDPGINDGAFSVESVSQAASGLADLFRDQTWKPVPVNVVPAFVTVDGTRINAVQFLVAMAEAYLDPTPGKKVKVERSLMVSPVTGIYPRRIAMDDTGNTWTVKPAVLHLPRVLMVPPPPPLPTR